MAKVKLYTGLVLENDTIKVAVVSVDRNTISLKKVDRFSLVRPIERSKSAQDNDEDVFRDLDSDLADEGVFGIDLNAELDDLSDIDVNDDSDDLLGNIGDDIDLELVELDQGGDEIVDLDMVDETDVPLNNEMLLYNILTAIDAKKMRLGLNIPAGVAIFQNLKDTNFNDIKKKDLQIILDDKIESIYGSPKAEDYYSYMIKEDGGLLLGSIDEEPQTLRLVNQTLPMYSGKITIEDIYADETLLMGLVNANYEIDDAGITCILQFSELTCRVIFMKGKRLWLLPPIITEGTRSRKFLNTVFSKILFQLDTGEVPNLDRLIICNNSLGDTAKSFFEERFPDVEVHDFRFSEEFMDLNGYDHESIATFTTAIATACAATGAKKNVFPEISFLPKYVSERQKIFKLQWHGFLLLFLILISFPTLDYVRKQSSSKINVLEQEISLLDTQINSFSGTVNNYNRINNELGQIQNKLELLNTLAENSIMWSTNLDLINSGIEDVNSVWLTSFSEGEGPNTLELQGIARYRSQIPQIANLFADATLLSVSRQEIRGTEVYVFAYRVDMIVDNINRYTPDNLRGLEDLTQN